MPSRRPGDSERGDGYAEDDDEEYTTDPSPEPVQATDPDAIERIVGFEEPNPSAVLGARFLNGGGDGGQDILWVRAYLPRAVRAWAIVKGEKRQMDAVSDHFYEVRIPEAEERSRYTLSFVDASGYEEERADPYSFGPVLTDFDLHLIGEGTHQKSYEKLGAHAMTLDGVRGVHFAVWAPNARAVSVVGDFNHWLAGAHPMNNRGSSGIWELFIPGLGPSEVYKYAIRSNKDGSVLTKTDPYAFRTELRPNTAAIVADLGQYPWGDEEWLELRAKQSRLDKPISVYEVHLGSWMRKGTEVFAPYLSYREIADKLVPYVSGLGFTHIELLPVMEHPLDDSWGYQVVNFYAPTSRFGAPSDLMYLIDECHKNGIGVILDWVPGHFPTDGYGLALFDGTHLYSHEDPRQGMHTEWGTMIFNYSRKEVRTFLISNAIFWLEEYHVDGLRLDAVASMLYLDYARKAGEWIPNEYGGNENLAAVSFLRELNQVVHSYFPHAITIAEESTAWPGVTRPTEAGGLGFDLKWNMGWMHDTLDYFSDDPIYRKYHQSRLTFSLWYAFSERFILVLSHDEVVYGKRSLLSKMPGDDWQKRANLRLCFGYMFTHPGKKLLFMGGEFGQWNEWDFRKSLDWYLPEQQPDHSRLALLVGDLNRLYRERKELYELDFSSEGFEWIDFQDTDNNVITFLRKSRGGKNKMLVALNMSPVPRFNYRVGAPDEGHYREILNSDGVEYGGSGLGNSGGVDAERVQWNGRPYSLRLTLPPLAILIFSLEK
jgi:1,4-alpha-glucan branching enzyme